VRIGDGVQRHVLETQPVLGMHGQSRTRGQQVVEFGIGGERLREGHVSSPDKRGDR
jgi:hypothetical protein